MKKILDSNQNHLKFIEPVILNPALKQVQGLRFQDLILRKNEMLNQAQHDTCVRIQKNHFDDLDLELGIYLGFGI
jgi:hypothetical protein